MVTADLSLWQVGQSVRPVFEPMRSPIKADVVVIGGGLAGLGCALHLMEAKPGLDLVLLEANELGYGASGRNAGIVESPLLMPIWLLEGSLPSMEANWALRFLHRRIESEMQRWLAACSREDVRPARVLFAARSRLAAAALRYAQRRTEEVEIPSSWCSAAELEDIYGAHGFGAMSMPGYAVNPLAIVHTAADLLTRTGARIYQDTAVKKVLSAGTQGVELETLNGVRIRTRSVVISVGAWSRGIFNQKQPEVIPIATYILASELLDDSTIARLGGEDLCISEVFNMSYRRIYDRRLLFGGTAKVLKKADVTPEFHQQRTVKLRHLFAGSLPWLKDLKIEMTWGGPTSSTSRGTPLIAEDPRWPGVYWNTGYQAFLPAMISGISLRALVLGSDYRDPDGERLRKAYMSTHIPWTNITGLGLKLIWQTLRG